VFADLGGRHESYESAEALARLKVALNPLTDFYVMRAVARVATDKRTIVVEELEP